MKLLKDILYGVGIKSVFGSTETYINTIQFDSRKISNEDLFVAIKGIEFDGHDFIQDAINKGANTIVHEDVLMSEDKGINYVQVEKSSSAAWIWPSIPASLLANFTSLPVRVSAKS